MNVSRVLVVVPARDEEQVLGGCLTALERARSRCPVPVDVVVVADRCEDRTAEVARAAGVRVVPSDAGLVGAARAAGVAAGLDRDVAAQRVWIANTDADSRVPADWLWHQVCSAAAGVDLLLGTVALDAPVDRHVAWRAGYAAGTWGSGHRHVHGANLGVRASRYLEAGGFPPVATGEDRLLAERVRGLPGVRVVGSTQFPVLTSARRVGRAPDGVAHDLSA